MADLHYDGKGDPSSPDTVLLVGLRDQYVQPSKQDIKFNSTPLLLLNHLVCVCVRLTQPCQGACIQPVGGSRFASNRLCACQVDQANN